MFQGFCKFISFCPLCYSSFNEMVPLQNSIYFKLIIIFSRSKYFRAGKVECRVGLKPTSLGVWASAFTFRPPAFYAPRCSLTLIQELLLSDSMTLTIFFVHVYCMHRELWDVHVHCPLIEELLMCMCIRWNTTSYLIRFSFAFICIKLIIIFSRSKYFRAGKVEC